MNKYYKILGLEQGASLEDVKKSYRSLAKIWHPDINKSDGASLKFSEIKQAYEKIIENFKESTEESTKWKEYEWKTWTDDFGGRINYHDIEVEISLKDIYHGGPLEISHKGEIIKFYVQPGALPGSTYITDKTTENYFGISTIRIKIQWKDSDDFSYDKNYNLICLYRAHLYDILLGGEGIIDIFGERVKFKIPKGTNSLEILRLRGKGVIDIKNGVRRDVLIQIIPTIHSISEQEEKWLKRSKKQYDEDKKRKEKIATKNYKSRRRF